MKSAFAENGPCLEIHLSPAREVDKDMLVRVHAGPSSLFYAICKFKNILRTFSTSKKYRISASAPRLDVLI